MDAKLTLKLDKEVIEKAKEYAKARNRSLSRMFETYVKALINDEESNSEDFEISPFVKSLSANLDLPQDFDVKKAYRQHLEEKYK